MEITPKNIANRTFTVTHRGYDRKEVQDFLAELAHGISMQQIRNGDYRSSNAVVDSVMGSRSSEVSESASSDPEVAEAFRDASRIRAEADAYFEMRKRAADALMDEARSQAAAGLASMPTDWKKADPSSSRPISSVKFDELSNAEREIVSRLSVTSKDLQRSYGSPKIEAIEDAPAASAPGPVASSAPTPERATPERNATAAPAARIDPDQAAVVDIGDDLEVVKNASSLLDGVLDDVMGSLRGESS